jgi:hypothetical protein
MSSVSAFCGVWGQGDDRLAGTRSSGLCAFSTPARSAPHGDLDVAAQRV